MSAPRSGPTLHLDLDGGKEAKLGPPMPQVSGMAGGYRHL